MKRLLFALALLFPPGLAAADTVPDGPVAADRYLERDTTPPHRGCAPTWAGERATSDGHAHGDVAVQAGTDGSTGAAARLCAPLGDAGQVTIAVSRSEGGRWRGPHPTGHPTPPDDR